MTNAGSVDEISCRFSIEVERTLLITVSILQRFQKYCSRA